MESRDENDITLELIKSKLIVEHNRRKQGAEEVEQQRSRDTAMNASQSRATGSKFKSVCFFCKNAGDFKKDCEKYAAWKAKVSTAEKSVNEKVCFSVQSSEAE